ncbi:MAG: SRPBCC family protein [Myxococcota bacterium]
MSNVRVELQVEIAARPATVWQTLTEPESFGRWMGAAMGEAEIDPRLGGGIRVTFPGTVVVGEITAFEAPKKLAFTWGYEGGQPVAPGASLVTLELDTLESGAAAGGTRLTLTHAGLPDEAAAAGHRGGWRLYTSVLAGLAAAAAHEAHLRPAVDGWFAAWAEPDAGRRAERLAGCTTEAVAFRHAFAALVGRDDLSGHIATSQRHMAGMTLEADGEPTLCHGFVKMPWRVVQDGAAVAAGVNFGQLDLDGRFSLVVGF